MTRDDTITGIILALGFLAFYTLVLAVVDRDLERTIINMVRIGLLSGLAHFWTEGR